MTYVFIETIWRISRYKKYGCYNFIGYFEYRRRSNVDRKNKYLDGNRLSLFGFQRISEKNKYNGCDLYYVFGEQSCLYHLNFSFSDRSLQRYLWMSFPAICRINLSPIINEKNFPSFAGFYKQLPEPISSEECRRLQYRRKSDSVKKRVKQNFANIW